jgi:hypothetical protein
VFTRILKIAVVLFFLPMAALAQTSPEKAAQLLSLIGFDETFVDLRQDVIDMARDGTIPTGTKLASVWPVAAEQHFDSDKMLASTVKRLAGLLSEDEADNLLVIFGTDFALKITEVEEREQNALPFDQTMEKGGAIISTLSTDAPARLQQYFDMIEVVGALDSTVSMVKNMQYAFLSGASLTGLLPEPMTDAQIVEGLNRQEPQLRRDILNNIVTMSAFIYRDLSDDEVAEYITLLSIPEVARMYALLGRVTGDVMSREFARFSLKLGKIAPQSEL